ncbi:hypothetical protein ACFX1Q_008711 [Malus domestica]
MPLSGLSEEKTRGSKVWPLQPQQTGTVDGDKNGDRTTFSGGRSSELRTAEQLRVGVGGVYFIYIWSTMKDNSAGVRKASVHALKNNDIAPSQKIGLTGDFDISVAISAIGLVKQLLRHQLLPPEIRHVIGASEYEHLIAQVFNSSQFAAKGFSSHDHGTINIAYRGINFICVGLDSKLTDALTGHVTDLTCNKFYQLSRNIYITMAGFRMAWEELWQWMTSVFLRIPEESHTVELAANLAYHFVSPYGIVHSLVLGWDFTSPHPQMFRVIPGISLTSDSAMAVGSGEEHINLRDLTYYNYGELAHAFHNTMLLLKQACLLDPFCGGIVIGRVLQRNQPPSCQYLNFFY